MRLQNFSPVVLICCRIKLF